MEENFTLKIEAIKKKFNLLTTPEDRYSYLIDLGRALSPYPPELRTPDHIVPGCQSTLYLATTVEEGKLFFSAQSDALISAGLAALLIAAYSGTTPKYILLNPPAFLHELGIFASLSPNRSNGLASIYMRMKQEAMKNISS